MSVTDDALAARDLVDVGMSMGISFLMMNK